jgi:hypothetical protein
VAGRPLRPATHRCLGEPLPHQLANGPRAPPQAPTFMKRSALEPGSEEPGSSLGISPPFGRLFPTQGQVAHVLLTRSPLYRGCCHPFLVRLACVRHAASVRSEPGSNSPFESAGPEGPSNPKGVCLVLWVYCLKLRSWDALLSFQRAVLRENRILVPPGSDCQDLFLRWHDGHRTAMGRRYP